MFGKSLNRQVTIAIAMLGFCVYIVKLFIVGQINLYIHPRYSYFALVMSLIAGVILVAGLVIELRKKQAHKHDHGSPQGSGRVVNTIVGLVLALALVLPPTTLSYGAIEQRTLKKAPGDTGANYSTRPCPTTEPPESIYAWVYEIGQYPLDCYDDQDVMIAGFVFESPTDPLPDDMFYLGRVVMSCCAIDAQPYALPVKKDGKKFPKDSWWRVEGVFEKTTINGLDQLVVVPKKVTKLKTPDNPYGYIDESISDADIPADDAESTSL